MMSKWIEKKWNKKMEKKKKVKRGIQKAEEYFIGR